MYTPKHTAVSVRGDCEWVAAAKDFFTRAPAFLLAIRCCVSNPPPAQGGHQPVNRLTYENRRCCRLPGLLLRSRAGAGLYHN